MSHCSSDPSCDLGNRCPDRGGPPSDLHRHSVSNGHIEHWHEMGDPDYEDEFSVESHTHLVVLGDRNYVNEESGPAEWIGGKDGGSSTRQSP